MFPCLARNTCGILLLAALCLGCQPAPSPKVDSSGASDSTQQPALRVLVIEDPELAKAIEREWAAIGGAPLHLRELTQDEVLNGELRRLASDVVIFPSALLGELAGRDWLQPLAESERNDPRWQWRDLWEVVRLHATNWSGKTIAVPLGCPTFVLCYRADIFERLGISPPTTWPEYHKAAERLSDPAVAGYTGSTASTWHGTCEPLAANWAGEWLLARAAPYARHRNQFSTLFDYGDLRPLIDGAPFVRALEELASDAKYGPPDTGELDPAQVRRRFFLGQCAMAVTWLSALDPLAAESAQSAIRIGFAPLPGSADVYNFRTKAWDKRQGDESPRVPLIGFAGRMGAVTKECRSPATSFSLLSFMSSSETSARMLTASRHTTPFRESHLSQIGQWVPVLQNPADAQRYGEVMKRVLNEPTCLSTLRIPGRSRYLAVLDQAVRDVLAGKAKPQEALTDVAQQWDKISDAIGRDAQRIAYARSIGLEM